MPLSEVIERARRASRRSPGYLAKRLLQMGAAPLHRPWSMVVPHLVTEKSIVRAAGAGSIDALWERQQRAPFFMNPSDHVRWVTAFRARYPEGSTAIVASADRAVRHEFDLLGSGPVDLGPSLPWHTDFKTGRTWPLEFADRIDYSELERSSDVKVPWELSRCQHFTMLGQAYWLTGDERYAKEFVGETSDWMAANPWAHGVNWACAMDVALRAVSWIWGFYYMSGAAACASPAFRGRFLRELYLHGEHVATHIERSDVNGNHYLCDAVGLVFLGTFFRETARGRRWLDTGRTMIAAEIFNQTSDDGVDFEKSTAYHRLVLEAFVTCAVLMNRHGETLPPAWLARLERMLEFVEAYVKPDGLVPLIGDADDGRIQKLGTQPVNEHRYLLSTGAALFHRGDLKRGARRFWDESFWLLGPEGAASFDRTAPSSTRVESKAFASGGFYVLRSDRAHVIIDCGEVGMHGRGGHGHNDMLGFELWLDGMHLVSDCGAYLYTASREWRNRFRSTAFHNVVQVDGEEINRFVSPDHLWQLRDDARPLEVAWHCGNGVDYFRGSHTGYQRLNPPLTVTREVALLVDGPEILLRDSIAASGVADSQRERDDAGPAASGPRGSAPDARTLVWRFHLDPSVRADADNGDVRLTTAGREAWLQPFSTTGELALSIEDGWISPSYGVRMETGVVVLRGRGLMPQTAVFRFGLGRCSRARLQDAAAGLPGAHAIADRN